MKTVFVEPTKVWVPDVLLYNKYVLTKKEINKSYETRLFEGVKMLRIFVRESHK